MLCLTISRNRHMPHFENHYPRGQMPVTSERHFVVLHERSLQRRRSRASSTPRHRPRRVRARRPPTSARSTTSTLRDHDDELPTTTTTRVTTVFPGQLLTAQRLRYQSVRDRRVRESTPGTGGESHQAHDHLGGLAEAPTRPQSMGTCLSCERQDVAFYHQNLSIEESTVKIVKGERLCEGTLLRGLFVHSSGDYAEMLVD